MARRRWLRGRQSSTLIRADEGFVRAVAQWRISGLPALAKPESFFLGNLDFHRLQAGALVRAVTERLVGGTPAGAPPIDAGIDFQGQRLGIANDWFFSHAAEAARPKGSLRDGKSRGVGLSDGGQLMRGLLCRSPAMHHVFFKFGIALHRNLGDEGHRQPSAKNEGREADKVAKSHGELGKS